MRLGSRPSLLVLHTDAASLRRRIEIVPSLTTAIKAWTVGTRISPIWGIHEFATHEPAKRQFGGRHFLLFIGPLSPARLRSDIGSIARAKEIEIWVSTGCFNVVIRLDNNVTGTEIKREIIRWATDAKVPFEVWDVTDGSVTAVVDTSLSFDRPMTLPQQLEKLSALSETIDNHEIPMLRVMMQEYCALMSCSLTRASIMVPAQFDDLILIDNDIRNDIEKYCKGELTALEIHGPLLTVNAALARFSSQAFSGMPPIDTTECHFWTHSLLGTGCANLALSNLAKYVQKTLGEARIPERIAALKENKTEVPNLTQLTSDPEIISRDTLKDVRLGGPPQPVLPLVTYLSGRDGFSSDLQTLSAPLTVISECNSFRSSLLTITHELSHIFVRGVLAHIFPNAKDQKNITQLWEMTRPGFHAQNWFDAVRQLLVEGIISMEQVSRGVREFKIEEITADSISEMMQDWRRETQEIMVHTFDFRYFYNGNPASYISGIWHSWSAIPGIVDRVPEYVLRTLCAISSPLLKERFERCAETARVELTKNLEILVAEGNLMSSYAEIALKHLKNNWNHSDQGRSILDEYRARLYLVRLVTAFLYSETVAAQLYSEPYVAGGRTTTGYKKKRAEYDLVPIGNPLTFLRAHLNPKGDEAESLWVLHNLAFNLV